MDVDENFYFMEMNTRLQVILVLPLGTVSDVHMAQISGQASYSFLRPGPDQTLPSQARPAGPNLRPYQYQSGQRSTENLNKFQNF